MNLGMSASTIKIPFLSNNFNFLKKVSTKLEGQQTFFQRYFPLPFQITTTNNKDKRIGIVKQWKNGMFSFVTLRFLSNLRIVSFVCFNVSCIN